MKYIEKDNNITNSNPIIYDEKFFDFKNVIPKPSGYKDNTQDSPTYSKIKYVGDENREHTKPSLENISHHFANILTRNDESCMLHNGTILYNKRTGNIVVEKSTTISFSDIRRDPTIDDVNEVNYKEILDEVCIMYPHPIRNQTITYEGRTSRLSNILFSTDDGTKYAPVYVGISWSNILSLFPDNLIFILRKFYGPTVNLWACDHNLYIGFVRTSLNK